MIKLLIFLLKTNPDRISVRAVFQNPFSSSSYRACLIIKYSIVRLLYCFCWLFHIVYDVWTGTPYQCRCAGCSRLFAGITTPVLIKILYNVPDVYFRENDGELVFQLHNCLKIWLCFVEHLSTIFWGKYNVVLAISLRM